MRFKYRKVTPKYLKNKIKNNELLLTVDYPKLKTKDDIKYFTSILDIAVYKLNNKIELLDGYTINDYLKYHFDIEYCKYFYNNENILEVEEIVNKLKNLKLNSIEDKVEVLTMTETKKLYMEDLTLNRELKKDTLKGYESRFNHLFDFFGNKKNVVKITLNDVEEFNKYLSTILISTVRKSFFDFYKLVFEFLVLRDKIQKNYFKAIKIKQVKSKERGFTNLEILEILNKVKEVKKFKKPDIDLEWTVKLAAYSGLRISEISNIKMKDINLQHNSFFVDMENSSTKKHRRTIPIHKELLELMRFNKMTRQDNDYLVYNKFQKKSRSGNINHAVNKYFLKKYFNMENTTFHSFRKSFRRNLQIKNPKLETYINVLMAHSNGIGFDLYGENSTDWQTMQEIINTLNYNNIIDNLNFNNKKVA